MARQYYLPSIGVINAEEGGREWYLADPGVLNDLASGLITCTGIASAEAFGTAVLAGPILVTGIASAEAFGTAVLTGDAAPQSVLPSGIASAEAFGSHVVTGLLVVPTGIDSAEAFGTAFVFLGDISLVGIPSAEAFGSHTVSLGSSPIMPTGIPSAEAFGSPVVALSGSLILPLGIPSAEKLGIPTLTRGVAMAIGWDSIGSLDAGVPFGLLPPQDLEPFPNMMHLDFNSLTFRRWFEKLATRVRQQNQIHADQVQQTTLNIANFGTKLHRDLDDIQGGDVAGDAQHWSMQEKRNNLLRHWMVID